MACKITSKIDTNFATLVDSRTVSEAIGVMVARQIGLVVVTNATASQVVGVFSKRDLVSRVVGKNKNPARTQLKEVMTTSLIKAPHDMSCRDCLALMQENDCRHLLTYEYDRFVGVITMRDVADLMGHQRLFQDAMVNMMGGLTFAFVVAAIGMLVVLSPKMWGIMGRFF